MQTKTYHSKFTGDTLKIPITPAVPYTRPFSDTGASYYKSHEHNLNRGKAYHVWSMVSAEGIKTVPGCFRSQKQASEPWKWTQVDHKLRWGGLNNKQQITFRLAPRRRSDRWKRSRQGHWWETSTEAVWRAVTTKYNHTNIFETENCKLLCKALQGLRYSSRNDGRGMKDPL